MEFKMYHRGRVSFPISENYMTLEEFYEKIPEWISKEKSHWNHMSDENIRTEEENYPYKDKSRKTNNNKK